MHTTHTRAQMAKALNRSAVVVSGLKNRFELPVFESAGYSEAHPTFLQTWCTSVPLALPRSVSFASGPLRRNSSNSCTLTPPAPRPGFSPPAARSRAVTIAFS